MVMNFKDALPMRAGLDRGGFASFAEIREHENKFVKNCQNGDAAAWDQLVARHTRRVYRICYRLTRRECEARDMTQEVFMRIFRTLGSFRADEISFVAWLRSEERRVG